ncbi:hypothetical protein [Nocardioides astragali]|uniref:Uncharacterized protein n=1 Tax=Nocardioides astragali TaxID=1776736 RepID=A0ABW2MZ45_9ACTN|nr:hypothetical protein [Nocardioides astragali]
MGHKSGERRSTGASILGQVWSRPLPPEASAELDRFELKLREHGRAIYLSTPITTGEKFLLWRRGHGAELSASDSEYAAELKRQVIDENVRRVRPLHARLSENYPERWIIDPTVLEVEGWAQADYHRFWLEVLSRFVERLVVADGWFYSTGCTLEYAFARARHLPVLDAELRPVEAARAVDLLTLAADQLELAHLSGQTQREVATSLASSNAASLTRLLLKDEKLAALAEEQNVALFASFAPRDLDVRFALGIHPDERVGWSTERAIEHVLAGSRSSSVNVRSFLPGESKSSPFFYGLQSVDRVMDVLRKLAEDGYYTIVNETIDVRDGGVSGVTLGGVMEFGPDDTPRLVEREGTTSLPVAVGRRLLSKVYGVTLEIPSNPDHRYEFSVHPRRVGHRRGHVVTWETEAVVPVELLANTSWPNHFSRMIGDKTFGLLLAQCVGAYVPRTRVVNRRVAPFDFGTATGTGEWWLRTAPAQQTPGRFTSAPVWLDPFELLQSEDRDGIVASVLAQEAVAAEFSGATSMMTDGSFVIEGVAGVGDAFMLGATPPEELPAHVITAVRECLEDITASIGDVRLEWAFDGDAVWVLQMHKLRDALPGGVLSPGEAAAWIDFDPAKGLEVLRSLVEELRGGDRGVRVTGPVGITSHVGDLLRQAGIPGRFA